MRAVLSALRCGGVLYAAFVGAACVASEGFAAPQVGRVEIPSAVPGTSQRRIAPLDLARLRDIAPLTIEGEELFTHKGGFRISPDGTRFVFQLYQADPQLNRYSSSWFVANITDGAATFIGNAGEIQLRGANEGIVFGDVRPSSDAKWSADGRWIAYVARNGGETQLWRSSVDGAVQQQLTHNASDVRDFEWAADGRRLFFLTNARTRVELRDAYEAEARTGFRLDDRFYPAYSVAPVIPLESTKELWVCDLSNATEHRATAQERTAYEALTAAPPILALDVLRGLQPESEFYRQQLKSSSKRTLAKHLTLGVAQPVIFSDGKHQKIAFAKMAEGPQTILSPLSTVSVVRGDDPYALKTCAAPECTGGISHVWWSQNGEQVFFRNADPIDEVTVGIYAWTPGHRRVRKIFETQDELDACSAVPNQLICMYSSPTQPRVIAALNLASGRLNTLVDPNPEFRQIALTDVERLQWIEPTFGNEGRGFLVKPVGFEAGRKYPLVIVTLNPEGFLRGGRGDEYPIHALAAEGLMVLVFERSWKHFKDHDTLWRFSDGGIDRRQTNASLEAGVSLLENRGLIDPTRIAVTGLSEGSAITYYALSRGSRRYAAGIVSTQDFEPIDFYTSVSAKRRRLAMEAFGGRYADGVVSGGPFVVSPSFAAARFSGPLLFNLPDSELIGASQTIVALSEHGKPYDAYVFPNDFHVKWQPSHRYAIYRRNIQWLKFWLQDIEARDPVDPTQYERWHRLREQQRCNEHKQAAAADKSRSHLDRQVSSASPTSAPCAAS
jgi:dipeptidyl aminopeptidase/acylaminoacyl peptidase